jgi:hypothetical protein
MPTLQIYVRLDISVPKAQQLTLQPPVLHTIVLWATSALLALLLQRLVMQASTTMCSRELQQLLVSQPLQATTLPQALETTCLSLVVLATTAQQAPQAPMPCHAL